MLRRAGLGDLRLLPEYELPGSGQRADALTTAITTVFSYAMGRIVTGEDADLVRREQVTVLTQAFDLVEQGVGHFPGAAAP